MHTNRDAYMRGHIPIGTHTYRDAYKASKRNVIPVSTPVHCVKHHPYFGFVYTYLRAPTHTNYHERVKMVLFFHFISGSSKARVGSVFLFFSCYSVPPSRSAIEYSDARSWTRQIPACSGTWISSRPLVH